MSDRRRKDEESVVESWEFREGVGRQDVVNLLLCILDVADALGELEGAGERDGTGVALASAVRRMGTPIRKLLLDGSGYLFKTCFTHPDLHPFVPPDEGAKPVTLVQKFDASPFEFVWADGNRSTVEVPAYEQRTTIHPLHGVRHVGGQDFAFAVPFDLSGERVKFKRWMNAKVLQVGEEMVFTARDLLRDVVNNEGAHIGDGTKFALPDGSAQWMDNQRNRRYRAVSAVKFGALSYGQMFCLYTGFYLVSQFKLMLEKLPFGMQEGRWTRSVADRIRGTPTGKLEGRATLVNTTHHGVVLGRDRQLRADIDFAKGYTTVLKIPQPVAADVASNGSITAEF